MRGIFETIDAGLDRAIGADRLKSGIRARLLSEQIGALVASTSATVAAAFVTSLALVGISVGTPVLGHVVAWAFVLQLFLINGFLTSRRRANAPVTRPLDRALVKRAAVHSALFGILWGIIPIVVLPGGDPAAKVSVMVAIAGMLYVSGVALAPLPQASFAFAVPVLVGSLFGISSLERLVESMFLGVLIAAYTGATIAIALRSVRGFVRHVELEAAVREQRDVISLLLKEFDQKGSDWLWAFDSEGHIEDASNRFSAASTGGGDRLNGSSFIDFLRQTGQDNELLVTEIEHCIVTRTAFSDMQIMVRRGNAETWWRLTGKPAEDEFGAYAGYIGTASDITAGKLAEKRINYLAHNDPLTGLLNRTKFTEHLKQCVARLERYGSPFSILFLDLDQFKAVNDSRGHLTGDKLLAEVSRRIRATIRETDTAARLGGDEFAIILNSNCAAEETAALAARLVRTVGERYELDGEIVSVGVSIGIAMAPVNGVSPDQLLRKADLALYRAKAEGRGVYRFFESQMDTDVREKRILEIELRDALKDGEFVLFYQPLVSAESNRPSGFEALMRWNHPVRGLVPPAEFIPIAEQSGMIKQIGDWTVHEACHAAARWPGELTVAVNLSAKHFQLSDIAVVVRDALAASGLAPRRLELEVTESLLIEQPEQAMEKLAEIRALGVTIAMDDFGTGYSSLSHLLKFPFDKIKIDKTFVMASTEDAAARDTLRTIASLGRTLDIAITAEGVETLEQVEFLRGIACQQLQGFYFAKPLDELDLAAYFLRHFEREVVAPERDAAARRALMAG